MPQAGRFCSTALCFLTLISPSLSAQVTTGAILGTVRDASGAVLPGVSVTVKNLDRGDARIVVTDDQGRYRASELTLASYEIQAELAGFQTAVRTGIKVTIGREAVVDITLKVGEISEKVVVKGEAPLVETVTSTITGLVDDKQIRDLPLNGRSFTQLAALQEGVASPKNFESIQPGNEGQKLSISGTRITQTAFLLDGTDIRNHNNTTPGSVAGVLLGVDTVREFSVVTSAASAENGGFTGGVVNAVTRSGTNDLHGSVFEFLRNSSLDARNFFDPKGVPPFKRNQFGFTLGGPIVRNKTFFFGSYEALRDRLALTRLVNVPDQNTHQGILPSGRVEVSPKVRPFLNLYPLPNGRNFGNGTGEFIFADSIPTNEDYFMVKVDHIFSDSDSMSVRYTFDDGRKSSSSVSGEIPLFTEPFKNRSQLLTVQEKKILSSSVINEFRFGFTRTLSKSFSQPKTTIDPSLRFIPLPDRTFGAINLASAGVASWGPSALATLNPEILNRFEYGDNVLLSLGRHSIKTGFKVSRLQFNLRNGVFADGFYIFRTLESFLTASPLTIQAKLGDTSAPGSVAGPLPTQGMRESISGIYVQDDFPWKANLTLNFGLRYELQTNPTEVGGRFANLDEPTDSTLRIGNPLFIRNPSKKSFGPRIGFAWDPFGDGKTSLRGGGGIFYDFVGPERLLGPQQQPPFFSQVAPLFPLFPNLLDGITPNLIKGNPAIFVFKTPKQAYVGQYNLTLQREILSQTVVTVGYQGSRGIKLGRLLDANLAPVQIQNGKYFWPADARRLNPNFSQIRAYFFDGNSFFNSLRVGVQHRFSHGFQFQSSYTYGRTIDESSNTANFDTGGGTSNGVSSTPFDHKLDRGLSAFDVRHVYSLSSTFELPFGTGKPLGRNATGIAGQLISGWQASSILSFSTGAPVNVRLGDNRSRSQAGPDISDRPDLAPGASNNPVLGGADRYFDPQAFVLQPVGFFGNVGRDTIIGPGVADFDLSLIKDTALPGEGRKVEFRAEVFNLANRANFGNPVNTVFSGGSRLGNTGRITTTTTTARQIQFALKVIF